MSIAAILTLLVALAVGSAAAPAIITVLNAAGVLDHPSGRSSHAQSAVRGAGLLCAVAVVAGSVCASIVEPTWIWLFLLIAFSGVAATVLGFLEDRIGIPILIRAGGQLIIGMCAAALLCVGVGLSAPVGVISAFAIASYMNIANFMDGVDMMSVGHAVVVSSTWIVLSVLEAAPAWMIQAGCILMGSFLAFLPWNLRTPKTFLGDAGSYLLGALISTATVAAIAYGTDPVGVLAPLAIYAADTGSTLGRRVLMGKRWYESHREHVYHQLEDLGDSHLVSTGTVAVFSALCALLGVLAAMEVLPSGIAWLSILAIAGCYVALPLVRTNSRRVRARADE